MNGHVLLHMLKKVDLEENEPSISVESAPNHANQHVITTISETKTLSTGSAPSCPRRSIALK